MLTRRKFIATFAIGLFATAIGIHTVITRIFSEENKEFLHSFSAKMYNSKLGDIYLKSIGHPLPTQAHIISKISSKLSPLTKLSLTPDAIIQEMIRNDLQTNLTFQLDGWIVAETAVYISALASLDSQNVH